MTTTATAAALSAAHHLLELCMGGYEVGPEGPEVTFSRDAVRSWTLDIIEALTPAEPVVLSDLTVHSLSLDAGPNAFGYSIEVVPEHICLAPGPDVVHEPHDWWYTSSGGGHQLSGPDPDERNVKHWRCPGVEAPVLAVCPECQQGKCGNCDSTAWDQITDTPTACSCTHPSLPCEECGHPGHCHAAKGGCTVPVGGPHPRCGCAEASRISEVTR